MTVETSELVSPWALARTCRIFSPTGPSQSAIRSPASGSAWAICGALCTSELTSRAITPPTAATRTAQVSPAATERLNPRRTIHGITG